MEHLGNATFKALGKFVGEVKHGVEEGIGELVSQLSPDTSPHSQPSQVAGNDTDAQENKGAEREHGRGGAGRREGVGGEAFRGEGRGFRADRMAADETEDETQHAIRGGGGSLSGSVDADARAAFLEALQTYKAKMSELQATVSSQQGAGGAAGSPPSPTSPPASLERLAAARACESALHARSPLL